MGFNFTDRDVKDLNPKAVKGVKLHAGHYFHFLFFLFFFKQTPLGVPTLKWFKSNF